MDLKMIFGKNVKFYRFQKNYTQAKLAEKVGISTNYLSEIECGLHSVDFKVLDAIASNLDIEVFQLFIQPKDSSLPRRIDMNQKNN